MSTNEFDEPLVEVTVILADAAQVSEGKLYILGGGLQAIGPQPQPVGIALLIKVPWDRANVQHDWKLELLDEDGVPVIHNDIPVIVSGQFEAGRPAGWPAGTPMSVPLAINFSALPVLPGRRYTWRFVVNDTTELPWQVSFAVNPAPATAT